MSVGFQLGGQAFSQIVFFQDKRAFDEFTGRNYEFSADATTAGNRYNKGMVTFTVAKGGLMYEASIDGQKFSYTPK